jgi:hypothetical protein
VTPGSIGSEGENAAAGSKDVPSGIRPNAIPPLAVATGGGPAWHSRANSDGQRLFYLVFDRTDDAEPPAQPSAIPTCSCDVLCQWGTRYTTPLVDCRWLPFAEERKTRPM